MQGVIQSVEYSKKGAPKFKINGAWYYAGRCKVEGLHVGAEIEFESKLFGDQNNLNSLEWWKPARGGQPSQSGGNASNAPQSRSNGAAQASAPNPDVLILPFISNTIAHAIQAGLIKQPQDLTGWVLCARAALSAKPTTQPRRTDYPESPDTSHDARQALAAAGDFDDDIPF
jgi:hypothetical protein